MLKRLYKAQRHGNLLWIRAAIGVEGGEPISVRLMVDTGSSFTVLPTMVLEDAGCNMAQPLGRITTFAAGGRLSAPIVAVSWFNCLGKQIKNFPVVAFNLPVGVFVDGLLGMDFLSRFGAVINMAKAEIFLSREVN